MKLGNNLKEFKLTLVGDTFQGILKIETETKGQSVSNSLLEPFFVLSLDLPQNKAQYDEINSLFKLFFSRRDVETGNCINILTKATKLVQRSYLERPPSVLIVHLKTFLFDQTTFAVTKTTRLLIYEESVTLNKEYLSPGIKSIYGDVKYELFSSNYINHH
jgi:hypothetical protein